KKGSTIGIIGGTGSGKSTLVNLIPRFYDATEGTVEVNGADVRSYTEEDLNAGIGVVPQKAVLFKGTVRDNLRWGNENATDEELWEALRTAQAADVVKGKDGELDFELEQNGRNLSGGQKQRLTIARALVKKPEILIMDDSASALDFATDAALRQAVKNLDGSMTVFIVSQRTSSIRSADQILVLDDGNLVGKGTHRELMADCEVYREIYYSQFPEERPANGKEADHE
ncbi:MAG: ABC transporter ATP-binding protein, partial [Eubacterium sp.]|nr:ABC transporter ATP-binding protein [Eubacterium sp.]